MARTDSIVNASSSSASASSSSASAPCYHYLVTDQLFVVGVANGFLPREDPLAQLPQEYAALESLLQRMSIQQPDGSPPGLLANGQFGDAVRHELPEYDVSSITDTRLLSALYRDLTFAASAYLLEPCDVQFRKDGTYGLGRDVLPRQIAVPLSVVAQKIGARPFMEYAMSYALYNYRRRDESRPLDYDNLELIRAFSRYPAEHGFILVHVAMVRHASTLVAASLRSLDAVEAGDRDTFNQTMRDIHGVYMRIIGTLVTMWRRSDPGKYLSYRTFIMGTKNQPMFPDGVIYEGVSTEPFRLRGESGANDSMVPLGDNLLELTASMPSNPLTEVLRDFRSYRPRNHRIFLEHIQHRAAALGLRAFALDDARSAVLYLANLDLLRSFRHHHWHMTKEYIIERTEHPVATGGSPIVTWLPNQLAAVLDAMAAVVDRIDTDELAADDRARVTEISARIVSEQGMLAREVAALARRYGSKAVHVDAVEAATRA
ncbi:hypothetical protein SYNPS1DRAFT_32442 [Syncephalis pseudoplumigaleata]|uniref:Indoleamine 2,3-dioxygenase n=1 Tax=Syncephalis pseudoplumigaleata TaxID=1712513 RepID=A0A4P9Z4T7_9FUNG|nr:hypothetical protein SYNPS1DRAFT_32442 [Syncephalis pseudoplumigaleata]|eukprot:RKP27485.1 hypothetical protein SYNPS1DRAFT_32442 [Syncephalis pseudoplumigaleata]